MKKPTLAQLEREQAALAKQIAQARSKQGGALPSYAHNASELADMLNTSRQRIAAHLRKGGSPGRRSDGRYPVKEWRDYLATVGHSHTMQGEEFADMAAAKLKFLLLSSEKLKTQIAVMRHEYIPVVEVEALGAMLGSAVRKELEALDQLAPSIVGLDLTETGKLLREKKHEILVQLHLLAERLNDWKASMEGPEVEG